MRGSHRPSWIVLSFFFVASPPAVADTAPIRARHALLIGIDDYSATRLGPPTGAVPPPRDRAVPQLLGAVNDITYLSGMLTRLYRFKDGDIRVLKNQDATRAAIFAEMETLIASTSKGDIVLFYYGGHGSKVRNSESTSPNKMDESVLPADARRGARDILDKDVRRFFNRLLDRGARLTAIFDTCYSGSIDRSALLVAPVMRSVAPDLRDVHDGSTAGPWPVSRGALILTATDEETPAGVTRDAEGKFHGAFSWALFQALRDAAEGEPAADTFLAARARLQVEMPLQTPVIAGNDDARLSPFLDVRSDRRDGRTVVAVEEVESDGTVVVQGGWANGIAVGSRLESGGHLLEVTSVDTLTKCRAREVSTAARAAGDPLHSGSLARVVAWVAPLERPMRVFIPHVPLDDSALAASASLVAAEAARRRVRWIDDPTESTPDYVLRSRESLWELASRMGETHALSTSPVDLLARIPADASLFVQLPASDALVRDLGIPPESDRKDAIVRVAKLQEADYVLSGHFAARRLEYAWVRAVGTTKAVLRTGLPARSDWKAPTAIVLRDLVLRLRRAQGWLCLDSPPAMAWPYSFAVRRTRDGALVANGVLKAGEQYTFVMRPRRRLLALPARRRVYVFMIDSCGNGVLLYPTNTGSVENRFPALEAALPLGDDVPLGPASNFHVMAPFGFDTYFMLTTGQALTAPEAVFNFQGARTANVRGGNALEELLLQVGEATRSTSGAVPPEWSIERIVLQSMPRSGR